MKGSCVCRFLRLEIVAWCKRSGMQSQQRFIDVGAFPPRPSNTFSRSGLEFLNIGSVDGPRALHLCGADAGARWDHGCGVKHKYLASALGASMTFPPTETSNGSFGDQQKLHPCLHSHGYGSNGRASNFHGGSDGLLVIFFTI